MVSWLIELLCTCTIKTLFECDLHIFFPFLSITGSEERNKYNFEAFEKLKIVASLTCPPMSNSSPGASSENLDAILSKIHSAKDKHIFRCKFIYMSLCKLLIPFFATHDLIYFVHSVGIDFYSNTFMGSQVKSS